MRSTYVVLCLILIGNHTVSCNSPDVEKTAAERKAEEQSLRNPIKKGRYKCWLLLPEREKATDDLYILSDQLYQVNDVVGHYRYHAKNGEVEWIDGAFRMPTETWIGSYFAKGVGTTGKSIVEPAILIQSQTNAGRQRGNIMRCNCVEFE